MCRMHKSDDRSNVVKTACCSLSNLNLKHNFGEFRQDVIVFYCYFNSAQATARFMSFIIRDCHLVSEPKSKGSSLISFGIGSNSTWLDSTRSTLSSQSSKSRRACRARRAVLFQHGGRRTILYKFRRFYALAYTNPICFIK